MITELYFDCSKAEQRLKQLVPEIEKDIYFKPRKMKSKWNPALIYPSFYKNYYQYIYSGSTTCHFSF
jgi:hypothetical protein